MRQNETKRRMTARKENRKITVREIARRTGYAPCTVARALSDDGCVALQTRTRILESARALGYIRRSGTNIAVLIPSFGNRVCCYNTAILHALADQLDREHFRYELIPENHLRAFNEKMLDGAVSICYTGKTAKRWSELNSIPLVCINDFSYHPDRIYSVCSNDLQAMTSIADHLHAAGHSRVLFLERRMAAENLNHEMRKRAFQRRAEELGLALCYASAGDLCNWGALLLREKISAVVCPFEMTDLGIFASLLKSGLRIPQDVELVHWHVPGISDALMPDQFTVRQDFPALARAAVGLLKRLFAGERVRDVSVDYVVGP